MSVVLNLLKFASWLLTAFTGSARPDVVILMYHRVTGDVPLELDLPFSVFREQMSRLANTGHVVSLDEAVLRLERGERFSQSLFVITFDDAYEDFYTFAFPFLKELGLPVTLYVPTGFIENAAKPPISRQLADTEKLKPMTWDMLQELALSPLLTIGSHTHSHRELPTLHDSEVLMELEQCDSLLNKKLGQAIRHFAYPRGVWDERVESLITNRYVTVTLAEGGAIRSADFEINRIPRVPVRRSDGLFWFNSRVTGRLVFEERFVAVAKKMILKSRVTWASKWV